MMWSIVCHHRPGKLTQQYGLGSNCAVNNSVEKALQVLVHMDLFTFKLNMNLQANTSYAASTGVQPADGGTWERPICPALVRSKLKHCLSCSAVPSPGLRSSWTAWKIWGNSVESHQDDERVGGVDTGRKVAGIGYVQPREETVQVDITTVLQYLKGSYRADWVTLFTRMFTDKIRGEGLHKWCSCFSVNSIRKEILHCENN